MHRPDLRVGDRRGRGPTPKWRNVIFSWVARSMSPASRMSPAVSSIALVTGLILFFFAIVHCLNDSFGRRPAGA